MQITPLPVVVPLVMAALLAALEKIHGKHRVLDILCLGSALAVLLLDLVLLMGSFGRTIVYWFGGWSTLQGFPVGIAFVVDPAGAGLATLASMLTVSGLLFSWYYFNAVGTFYHSIMLLFLASMQGFCLTGDLFNMFVFFELMGVTAYALTGYKIEDTGPLEGALNFSVMNSIGGFLVLFGIGLVYGKTGGLNLAWAGSWLHEHGADRTMTVAFMLLVIGFLVKGAIVPFHFWLPDAHAVAPTPASMLFSGIMVELGLYAVARIYWTVFSTSVDFLPLRDLLLCVGAATALIGGFMACIQRHMKRLLAFSTVSHSGMMLAGIALLESSALGGTFLYMAGHGMVKAGLFVGTGIILYHYNSVDEEKLRGKGKDLVITGPLFCLSGLALAGLPPFATCSGKDIVEKSAEHLGFGWISMVFLVASALTGGAVLRAAGAVFLGWGSANFMSQHAPASGDREPPETAAKSGRTPLLMWLPFLLLLLCALAAGAAPVVGRYCVAAAERFSDAVGYQEAVLRGAREMRQASSHAAETGWQAGLVAALLAVATACAFLFGAPVPGALLKGVKAVIRPWVSLFRAIHSGYVGDYVTWLMIGSAVMMFVAMIL